jgi:hypothetical protein
MTSQDQVVVEALLPGHSCDVSIEMISPAHPGIYEGQWRMTTHLGHYFGGKTNLTLFMFASLYS